MIWIRALNSLQFLVIIYINNLDNGVIGNTQMWQTLNMALPQTDNNERNFEAGACWWVFTRNDAFDKNWSKRRKLIMWFGRRSWVPTIRLPVRVSLLVSSVNNILYIILQKGSVFCWPSKWMPLSNLVKRTYTKIDTFKWSSFRTVGRSPWKRHKFEETRVKAVF